MSKTLQDLFNAAWERAKTPVKAVEPGQKVCLYRPGHNIPPCFIGVLIPDEKYHEKMEGLRGYDPVIRRAADIHDDVDVIHIVGLQGIHDHCDPEEWERLLRDYAKKYHLTIPGEQPSA